MCSLFGVVNYGKNVFLGMDELINALAEEATIRGTDATGIAYNKAGKMIIFKKPKSAYEMEFTGLSSVDVITGHTRHSTQGSEILNYNNHPFMGYCTNYKFALAHNGVLSNDKSLRKTYALPVTRIQTDSYIATQLLEHFNDVNFANIKKMSETLHGSFCFSILKEDNTLYLVKGDNPLYMLHFPKRKMYVYASTDTIVWKALVQSDLLKDIKSGDFEEVKIKEETILKIDTDGKRKSESFTQFDYWSNNSYYNYNWSSYSNSNWRWNDLTEDWEFIGKYNRQIEELDTDTKKALDDIKMVAPYYGFEEDEINEMYFDEKYSIDEICEFMSGGEIVC